MKRDMDLMRELLLKLEALPIRRGGIVTITPDAEEIAVPGFDADQIDYHLSQIRQAGLIDDTGFQTTTGIGFRYLTPAGHDFLDSIRNPETWAKTRKAAAGAGGFTLDLLRDWRRALSRRRSRKKPV